MTEANTDKLIPLASKIAQVISILQRTQGASLEEMIQLTSWQPNTTRAALTGLRKKRYEIARTSVDGITRYTIIGRSEPEEQ
ncbi:MULTISPECIES: DUF3489 domain-containing protein [Sphingobium]|uniref:DUF3489 domain-containing protein n=1 Tax=Sphingobium TaxID=165695 RepID=UPI0015EC5149|nr:MULTISPECIES: DUF3489 domain-containing protein [Sphingobium]MCW2363175.1 hypothetical protein [Sphingobium sp. B10D3B]MCW2368249.1 hypothetical protein [Sphingobium sp. B11D3D]MCW2400145.1 hypothetical protein [Sphingobium sp. B10D7B]MCW2407123.1 hypothetical protein [Sphingobium xanthum]